MMLIKTRGVAGDVGLAAEFLETIQPFRYPRSINENVLDEVAAMKTRIEQEVVKAGELDRNVKLGRGGIREIEFIAQARQLLRGGRQPFLQSAQTLPTLDKLAQYDLLSGHDAGQLREAYCFLRDVEHRLQMEGNRQTHSIPVSRPARKRLAALMGAASLKAFEAQRAAHARNVRRIYDKFLKGGQTGKAAPFPAEFRAEEATWKTFLVEHQFRDVDKALRTLQEFVEGPGYVHVSPRTADLARRLLGRLFARCPGGKRTPAPQSADTDTLVPDLHALSDPDRVVTRLDSFISAYGARATLFEIWNSNPSLFDLLVLLFDRSEFLAEVAIRTPDLIDEQVASGRIRRRRTAAETLADLRHGLNDADQHAWLRRYHQAEQMRIGLRDILGLADPEQYLTELSALADACLQYALESVMHRHGLKRAPFAVIGLGKLGGAEIDYGSDLDVLFVTDAKSRNLPRLQRVAVEMMDLVSRRTEHGVVFQMDARLRPDGDKGLLVNTLPAYEDYYRRRGQLWEIQAISRTRVVAGDVAVGEQFRKLAAALTDFRPENVTMGFCLPITADGLHQASKATSRAKTQSKPRASKTGGLAAYAPDWKQKIHQMRLRIEKERTPAGKDDLAIKTGKGGLVDAEFIAQALCLEHGWQEANTVRALERARTGNLLPGADQLIENYRRLRRVEGILRRWSYEGETVLPDDPAPYYRVSVRCGFPTPEAFREALAAWRAAVRAVFLRHFEQ
jgi:glutamate-ammonia-ligase adenylyltransferase